MLHSLLIAVGGVGTVLALWVAVQAWVRRETPDCPPDCDMLEHWACDHCFMGDTCTFKRGENPETRAD